MCCLSQEKDILTMARSKFLKRKFLKFLWFHYPTIPFFYLGDLDPFGFDILLNYAFGSTFQVFENLSLPNIIYLDIVDLFDRVEK